jgi:hypothetical protein
MVNTQQFDHNHRAVGHDCDFDQPPFLYRIESALCSRITSAFFRYYTFYQPSSAIFQRFVRELCILRVLPPRHNVRQKYVPRHNVRQKYVPRHMVHISPRIRFLQQRPERGLFLVRPVIPQQRELGPLLGLQAVPAHHHPQCRRRLLHCSIHRQCLSAALKPCGTALVL